MSNENQSDRSKKPELWQPRKREQRQGYYNIATGVTIALLVFLITGACGWVAKMQVTVNKADLALREGKRTNMELKDKVRVLHRRISDNHNEIKATSMLVTRVDERSKINRRDIEIMEIRRDN